MAEAVTIRPAVFADAAALSVLMGQLGYPATETEMTERLGPVFAAANYHTLIAEEDSRVVGMVGACVVGPFYEKNGLGGQIMALVVDPAYRGRGVGAALLTTAEQWLQTQGVQLIYLVSGARRAEAHRFYERQGYFHAAGEFLFVKDGV